MNRKIAKSQKRLNLLSISTLMGAKMCDFVRKMRFLKSVFSTPWSSRPEFSRIFAQNRTKIALKSHLVFSYLVGIQAIRPKSEKNDFPKNRSEKSPRLPS